MKSRILTYEGRQLCSARDPLKEAKAWCDLVLAPEGLRRGTFEPSHYWVIGLGAGFHIAELAQRRSDSVISVVEWRPNLLESFTSWGNGLRGQVLVENVQSAEDIFQTKSFQIYGLQFSSIFRYVPCLQGSELWSRTIESHLLGQSFEGFSRISQLMDIAVPGLETCVRPQQNLNIKMIDALFDGAAISDEKKIVSLLRELVR
jgi:hypothetical protein